MKAVRYCSLILLSFIILMIQSAYVLADGYISGVVLGDHDNNPSTPSIPVEGMHVQFFSDACNEIFIDGVNTDENGLYVVGGLPTGTDVYIRTCTNYSNGVPYMNEFYGADSADCNQATPVTITENAVSDINFDLQPGGTVSGRLLDPENNPLPNVAVSISDAPCNGKWLADLRTDDQGHFEIKGIPDIPVYLSTWNPPENATSVLDMFWDGTAGATNCMDAVPINVQPLQHVGNINITMQPAGSISGVVLGDHDNNPSTPSIPVEGIRVEFFSDACNWIQIAGVSTDENGNYVVNGLPIGTDVYIRTCTDCNNIGITYVDEYYDINSLNCEQATPVTITENNISDINFDLSLGGSISGVVLGDHDNNPNTPGIPLEGIHIHASTDPCEWNQVGDVNTESDGSFTITGLPIDVQIYVKTCIECNDTRPNYLDEYYNTNVLDCELATPITITENTTPDINFDLAPGGTISGYIVDTENNPVQGLEVNLHDKSCGGQWIAGWTTNDQGYFEIKRVPSIPVYLSTWTNPENDKNFLNVSWNGTANGSTDCMDAVPINVQPLQHVGNINITMQPAGSISGVVLGDHDNNPNTPSIPVEGMHLQIFSDACNWIQIAYANTDENGNYVVNGLPIGTNVYIKTCTNCNDLGIPYMDEYYDIDSLDCAQATGITITENNISDINFELSLGGSISGVVLGDHDNDPNTPSIPVEGMHVHASTDPCEWNQVGAVNTESDGSFTIMGLPIGVDVYVKTCTECNDIGISYADEYYDINSLTCEQATPVTVTENTTPDINFDLLQGVSTSGQEILTDTEPDALITTGRNVQIFGTDEANHITVESGATVELINFPGSNTLTIQANANIFTVYRSGATLILEGSDGTVLRMPASKSIQTLIFNDRTLELVINNNQIMLGSKRVGTIPTAVCDNTINQANGWIRVANIEEEYSLDFFLWDLISDDDITISSATVTGDTIGTVDLNNAEFYFFHFYWFGRNQPITNELYTFNITYGDGKIETVTAFVRDTLVGKPTPLSPDDAETITTLTPTFTWQAPSCECQGYYRIRVVDSQFNEVWSVYPSKETTSVVYNFDGQGSSLKSGETYEWHLIAFDEESVPGNGPDNYVLVSSTFSVQ